MWLVRNTLKGTLSFRGMDVTIPAGEQFDLDVLGPDGLAFEEGYELRQAVGLTEDSIEAYAKYQFLRSRANSIEGGTSEIMRNILGERVLGLPGEPRVDKDVAWKDVPRS